ncbi:MAG: hypothetical protein KF817_06210 [Phycisphaeraceae bacterium]|nr:hypothetical protein [Phycisphaeraceae bacterium]
MAISSEQLRAALHDLNGQRDVRVQFDHADSCIIPKALVVPLEEDRLLKLTDGAREYLIDVQRVAWIEIGPALGSGLRA